MKAKEKKSNNDSRKKDQYTIVLEDLRSQFKVFGESLDGFRKETRERLDKIEKNQEVTLEYLYRIDEEISDIKKELKKFDESRIDKSEFESLKTKIQEIEKELKRVIEWQKSRQKSACA
ncbi:MAG: hypothetical protein WC726_02235 [Parcubacteria group bacterium]|jgi:hypothetical protein